MIKNYTKHANSCSVHTRAFSLDAEEHGYWCFSGVFFDDGCMTFSTSLYIYYFWEYVSNACPGMTIPMYASFVGLGLVCHLDLISTTETAFPDPPYYGRIKNGAKGWSSPLDLHLHLHCFNHAFFYFEMTL